MKTSKQPGTLASEQPRCQPDSFRTASVDGCVTPTFTDPRGHGDLKSRQLDQEMFQVSLLSSPNVPAITNRLRIQCSATPKFYPGWMTIPQSRAQEEEKEDQVTLLARDNSPANTENRTVEVTAALLENDSRSSGHPCGLSGNSCEPSQDQRVSSKVSCGPSENQLRLTGESIASRVRCGPDVFEFPANQCGITGERCGLSRGNGPLEDQCGPDTYEISENHCGLVGETCGASRDPYGPSRNHYGPPSDECGPIRYQCTPEACEPSENHCGLDCQGSITTDYDPHQTAQKSKALWKEEYNKHNRKNGDRKMSERASSKNYKMFQRFTNALRKVLDDDLAETTDSNESDEETSPSSDTIKIRGVVNEVTAAQCEYYFQNPDKGGGDIEATEWDNNENTFYITFKDTNVAKRVVSSVHTIGNRDLEVSLVRRGLHGQVCTCTVEVSGCDLQLKDVYVLYFENPRHGGGAIKSVHEDKKNEKLFITFEKAGVAETVCCTKHKVRDRVLEVKLASLEQTTNQDDDDCLKTLEVTVGHDLKKEDEYLHYFQHCGHGYGGKVEDFTLDKENEKLLVTFDTAKVARRVAAKTHKIKGQKVEVNFAKAAPYDKNKLLFKNVAEVTTKEHLLTFVENVGGTERLELIYSDDQGTVLVIFQEKADVQRIKDKCSRKRLDGRQLQVCRVPVSNCIQVENLSPVTTDDEVAQYFESPRAGGGTVLRVKRTPVNGKCLVFFEDARVIEGVVRTKHRLAGKEIRVRLYLECLGPSGGSQDPFAFLLPEPLIVTSKENMKVCFVEQCRATLKLFNQHLAGVHAHAKVANNALTIQCTVGQSAPGVRALLRTWSDDVQRTLNTCFEAVSLQRLDITPEIWPTLKLSVEKASPLFRPGALVSSLDEENAYLVMGRDTSSEEVFQQICLMNQAIQKDMDRKKREVIHCEALQKFELDLLQLWPLLTEKEQHGGLAVDIRPQKGEISFRGLEEEILEVQVKIFRALRSIVSQKLESLKESKCLILISEESREAIGKDLKAAGLKATWEHTDKGVITVYCLNKSEVPQAVQIIDSSVGEEVLQLNELSRAVLTTHGWKSLEASLKKKNQGTLRIQTDDNLICISSLQQIMPAVKRRLIGFISEHTVYLTTFRFSPTRQKFVDIIWMDKFSELINRLSKQKVQITLENSKKEINVQGNSRGLELTREELKKMEASITCFEKVVERREDIIYLTRLTNVKELDSFACFHRCAISLFPEKSGLQIVSTNQPGEREVRVGRNHTMSAVEEDITQLKVDAIVNAANEDMQHIGGLAKRIVSRGGKEIQSECNLLLKTRDKLCEGDVLVTGPGKLPCKSIIHAVGPRYKGGNKGEEQCLQATVIKCLKTASDLGYTSIALPAISSGVFGYPVEEATRVIVEAVRLYFDTNPNSSIRDVLLCDILRNTVNNFQLALTIASYDKKPTTTTTTTTNTTTTTTTEDAEAGSELSNSKEHQEISISIVEGEIAMQEVDVIVNSTATNLSLNGGAISSSIATAAGPDLQRECHLKYPKGIPEGGMACTGGHNLACKTIFHLALDKWKSDGAAQQLQSSVEMCLKEASIQQFSTIAIPALGTGILGFPRDVVARTILTTVGRFPQKFPNTSVKEVRVVVYKDQETMQAFHTEQKRMAGEETEEIPPKIKATKVFSRRLFEESDSETQCSEDTVWESLETAPPKHLGTLYVAGQKQPIPEAVRLYIYATDSKRVAKIMKEFTSFVNGKFITKSLKDLNKLTDEEFKQIESLCSLHDVQLQKDYYSVTLRGLREDVDMVTREMYRIQNLAEQQKQETLTANLVQWYYIKETPTGVERKAFVKSDNLVIEHAYQSRETIVSLYHGSVFVVDFSEMEVSPKYDRENTLKVMRKEIIEDIASSMSMLPETWEPQAKSEAIKLVTLKQESSEYISVRDRMLQTRGRNTLEILQIQRVQNPELYQQYMAKKARIRKQNLTENLERTLWHGTSSDAVRNINLYGFNRSYCGKNATCYGDGVYFAVESSYSLQRTYSPKDIIGRRVIYQCKVLTGSYTEGRSGMKVLPLRAGEERYDSATNSVARPSMFVIFHDAQAYPEYLITFR